MNRKVFVLGALTAMGLVACNPVAIETSEPPALISEASSTPPETTTPSPLPPTATPTQPPDLTGYLVLFADGRYWRLSAPFTHAEPLFPEDQYDYLGPVWSPDGKWMAYDRLTGTECPNWSGSIWMSLSDGSEKRQISEELPDTDCTGIDGVTWHTPIVPIAWSADHRSLAVEIFDEPYVLSVETGEATPLHPEQALQQLPLSDNEYFFGWNNFSPDGSRALLNIIEDPRIVYPEKRYLAVMTLDQAKDTTVLAFPADFTLTYRQDGSSYINHLHTVWSPDGQAFAITDQVPGENRLWIVHPETQTWEIIKRFPDSGSFPPHRLSWSPDGKWIAWNSYLKNSASDTLTLHFYDTTRSEIVPSIALEETEWEWARDLGWVSDINGANRLLFWYDSREGGLYLIDPNYPQEMSLYLGYQQILDTLPIDVSEISILGWRR